MIHRPDTIENINRVLAQPRVLGSSDFDLNPEARPPQPGKGYLREAAVLVPLIGEKSELRIILTKRASHLKHHPGQIAFPGGKVETSDRDHTAAALREAQEEIGLSPRNVKILGHIPFHETVTHFRITPVVGLVSGRFIPVPNIGEVEEVFEVPLAYLANLENYRIEGRIWGGVRRQYFTIPYGPYYIWGATARILQGFAERLSK